MIRLAALLICLATAALPQQAAQEAAEQLQAAQAQLLAADGARDRIAALTQTVQAYEAGLAALREGQRDIALREAGLSNDLAARREEFARLLGVLSTIGATPQPVQRAHPQGPIDTVRAGMLLSDLAPALETEAADLRARLEQAIALRQARQAAAQTLIDGLEGAQAARAALGQAVSERTDLPQRFEDDPVQTALLLAGAKTLGAFAADVARNRPAETTTLTGQADLPLPVDGFVLPDDGSGRSGVRIAAAPRAIVTAPLAATILFQGALLDYGTVVILEPAVDVVFVIAGLAEVFGKAGQVLPAGTPIGLMGEGSQQDDGILNENPTDARGQSQQALYLEVREGQTPVSPDAWFALE